MALEPAEVPAASKQDFDDPASVRLSVEFYRLLAAAYPKAFRLEYGAWMEQAFRDQCLCAHRGSGAAGMSRLWADTLLDWMKTVVEQHSRKGLTMNRSLFIRAGGLCLIFSGVVMLVGALSTLLYSGTTDPQNFLFRPYDPWLYAGTQIWFPALSLLTTAGLLGLYARFGASSGWAGKAALIAGMLGGATAFGFFTALVLSGEQGLPGAWETASLGLLALFGGLAIFGVGVLRRRLLANWSWLPLATGLWFYAMVLISLGLTPEPPEVLLVAFFTVLTTGLILLGQRLLDRTEATAAI